MKISRSALLPYSAAQMYAVVADVDAYPEFLQWCDRVEVLDQQAELVSAKMHVAYGKLVFAFTTLNQHQQDHSINLSLIDGPFREFCGLWSFLPLESSSGSKEGCKISLEMDFRFEGKFASTLLNKIFEKIAVTQLDAFQRRAASLYDELAKTSAPLINC